jgi:signal peptide peptidase SppA
MNVIEILNAPWAIIPEKLSEIQEIYRVRMERIEIDLAAIEAQIGKPLDNKRKPYSVDGGTAIIPVEGVIAKKMNLFTKVSGGVSTEILGDDFAAAMNDPEVHSILLAIDSPGGQVDGTQALADQVFAARGIKPIVAVGDGMMASAAYWVGSAADEVYTSGDTTAVGSIGVVAKHTDYSQREHAEGIKVTEITAGKYKRLASEHEPLSKEGRQSIQEQVDHLYSVFVDNVARHRGVDSQTVANSMADGRIFLGKHAVHAGLVDGVSTKEAIVARLNRDHAEGRKRDPLHEAIFRRAASLLAGSRKPSPATALDLANRASVLQAEALAEGRELSNIEAVKAAYAEAGIPLR